MDDISSDVSLEPQEPPSGQGAARPLVLLDQSVLADMNAHATEELDHEIGGIMIGSVVEGDRPTVMVEASIRGRHLTYTRGSVTFTHDTWNEINRIKDEQYPNQRIVGWYHSHPGFGIFLSNYDLFIHQSFFTAPWQVAFVTDPKARTHGCFTWQDGDLAQDHEFRAVSAPGAPEATAPATEAVAVAQAPVPQVILAPTPAPAPRDRGMTAALWLLSGLFALLAALSFSNFAVINTLPKKLQALTIRLDMLQQDLQLIKAQTGAPKAQPSPAASAAPSAETPAKPAAATPADRPAAAEGPNPSAPPQPPGS